MLAGFDNKTLTEQMDSLLDALHQPAGNLRPTPSPQQSLLERIEHTHGYQLTVRGRAVAVYRHQVQAGAAAGPALLASQASPHAALTNWIDLFVDFLVTKHGLAEALQSDEAVFQTLHGYFLDRLVPVCAKLFAAARATGEIRPGVEALGLMFAVGNLCIGADDSR